MSDGVDAYAGPYEHIVAYSHRRFVEDGQAEVGHKIITYVYVLSEIATKRAVDQKVVPYASEHVRDYPASGFDVRRHERIEAVAGVFGRDQHLRYFGMDAMYPSAMVEVG